MTVNPLDSAIDDYLLALESEGRSPATLRYYGCALRRLARHAGPITPAQITPVVLRAWLKGLADDGLAVRSQRDYLSAAKTFVGWLAEEEVYGVGQQQQQQCRGRVKPPPEVVEQIVPFTTEQARALLQGCNPRGWMGLRTRTIIALLLDTGLRASELCGLAVGDVDLDRREIHVRAETSKVRRGRTISLGRDAKREMGRWWANKRRLWDVAPDTAWFLGNNERPMTPRTLHRLLTRHGEHVGVPDAHPHRFRHTFAVNCLRAGLTAFVLMRLLGHTDIAMTQRYVNFLQGDVSAEKRAHSPLDFLKLR